MNSITDDATIGDAWGAALLDHLAGKTVEGLTLELDDGTSVPAMRPEWFFRTEPDWEPEERQLLARVVSGPVLDLGAGAGRSALHLQQHELGVTAVESSPGAAEVCRRRGVRDVRTADLNDPPTDAAWKTILLLCGNLGLGGSWDGNRRLLSRLAAISDPDAVLIADSVNYTGDAEIGLRIRYRNVVTPGGGSATSPRRRLKPSYGTRAGGSSNTSNHPTGSIIMLSSGDHELSIPTAGSPAASTARSETTIWGTRR